MKKLLIPFLCVTMTACTVTTPSPQTKPAPTPTKTEPQTKTQTMGPVRSASSGVAAYKRVARRVEPVSERICRDFSKDLPAQFCDFQIRFDDNPKAAPNAYQTIGRDGKPIITFNVNMLRSIRNDDEIAFIMGHEAGHQIARHLLQKRNNSNAGAVLGAIIIGGLGGNPMDGANLGGMVGAQSFSKKFELQADRIGAHVAFRSGYNAIRGARSFERTGGSNSMLSTHPPGADRFAVVQQTVGEINAAKKQGKTAPIRW